MLFKKDDMFFFFFNSYVLLMQKNAADVENQEIKTEVMALYQIKYCRIEEEVIH